MTVLAQTGTPAAPLFANGLNAPSSVAIDQTGYIWVCNEAGHSVTAFTSAGTALIGSPFTASGNLSGPVALTRDATGNLFIANSTGNSVTEVNASGTYVQQLPTNVTAPTALIIDPK